MAARDSVTWRLRCEPPRPEFFYVMLAPNRRVWLAEIARDRACPASRLRSATGLCTLWRHTTSTGRLLPDLGCVYLYLGRHLDTGAVAHELLHATIGWARRVKLDPHATLYRALPTAGARYERAPNERLCRVMDRLTTQFWDTFFRVTRVERA